MKNVLVAVPKAFLFQDMPETKLPSPADWVGKTVNLHFAQVSLSCMPAIWNQIIPSMLNVNVLWIFIIIRLQAGFRDTNKQKGTRININCVPSAFQGLCANYLISFLQQFQEEGIAFMKLSFSVVGNLSTFSQEVTEAKFEFRPDCISQIFLSYILPVMGSYNTIQKRDIYRDNITNKS